MAGAAVGPTSAAASSATPRKAASASSPATAPTARLAVRRGAGGGGAAVMVTLGVRWPGPSGWGGVDHVSDTVVGGDAVPVVLERVGERPGGGAGRARALSRGRGPAPIVRACDCSPGCRARQPGRRLPIRGGGPQPGHSGIRDRGRPGGRREDPDGHRPASGRRDPVARPPGERVARPPSDGRRTSWTGGCPWPVLERPHVTAAALTVLVVDDASSAAGPRASSASCRPPVRRCRCSGRRPPP